MYYDKTQSPASCSVTTDATFSHDNSSARNFAPNHNFSSVQLKSKGNTVIQRMGCGASTDAVGRPMTEKEQRAILNKAASRSRSQHWQNMSPNLKRRAMAQQWIEKGMSTRSLSAGNRNLVRQMQEEQRRTMEKSRSSSSATRRRQAW